MLDKYCRKYTIKIIYKIEQAKPRPRTRCSLLGILNSKLISFLYIGNSSIGTKDDFRQTTLAELRKIPIPKYDKNNPQDQALVSYVNQMILLQQKYVEAKTAQDKEFIQTQIFAVEQHIGELIYRLYGVKDIERKLIEKRMPELLLN
jgi:hypothetical protein